MKPSSALVLQNRCVAQVFCVCILDSDLDGKKEKESPFELSANVELFGNKYAMRLRRLVTVDRSFGFAFNLRSVTTGVTYNNYCSFDGNGKMSRNFHKATFRKSFRTKYNLPTKQTRYNTD